MNLWQSLQEAETLLRSRGIQEPRVEAELLLMHAVGLDRARLYADLQQQLACPDTFWALVERRLRNEPTAYITNRRAFYGVDLYVDPRVMIPRQETELLVDEALRFAHGKLLSGGAFLIADVGTGSGAIAVALAINIPQCTIYAIDISADALEVASINCREQGVSNSVHLLLGDMLQPLDVDVDVIVGNLPYISDGDMEELAPEIRDFEPKTALAGGPDGLDRVRQLLPEAKARLRPGGVLLLEIGQAQSRTAILLCRSLFPEAKVDVVADLAGIDRVVKVTAPGPRC
jgi:release factor glutamine methyltransferase